MQTNMESLTLVRRKRAAPKTLEGPGRRVHPSTPTDGSL